MNADRFDALTRSRLKDASRRVVLGGMAGALALTAQEIGAKKKRKKRLKFNAFGCLNEGRACRGKNAHCCSGICKGKKPKKGQKDKSQCVGHDATTCLPGQTFPICGGGAFVSCTSSAGLSGGFCVTTTGNSAYCAYISDCYSCKKDADCRSVCGPQAACIACATGCPETGGTLCAGVAECALPAEPL